MDSDWPTPEVGATAHLERTFTMEDVEMFAAISGDRNPLHFDEAFAAGTRFGRLVVQGGLTVGLFNAIVAMRLPGPGSVFMRQEWEYLAPVYLGDRVRAEVTVLEARADKPVTKLACRADRADGTQVVRGECVVFTLRPERHEQA